MLIVIMLSALHLWMCHQGRDL